MHAEMQANRQSRAARERPGISNQARSVPARSRRNCNADQRSVWQSLKFVPTEYAATVTGHRPFGGKPLEES
jgi:hypothetical protein